MKQTPNSRRLNETAREIIANILITEVSDPRLDLVTVTGAEVSPDRSVMSVYVSTDPDRYDEVLEGLESAKGRIRTLLGKSDHVARHARPAILHRQVGRHRHGDRGRAAGGAAHPGRRACRRGGLARRDVPDAD